MTAEGRALREMEHGRARQLPPDVVNDCGCAVVLVFAHRDRAGAEAYAAANRDEYGHPSWVELRESVGWCSVVDIRPALAELDAAGKAAT
jgi:hypothetical protein